MPHFKKGLLIMNDEKIAIILRNDGSISYISRNKLSGNVRKKLKNENAEFILIPVGMFSPEYILIKVSDIFKKFGIMDFEYSLNVMSSKMMDNLKFEVHQDLKESKVSSFHITNYADFITVMYSLFRIGMFNYLYNSLSRTFSLGLDERFFVLDSVKIKYTSEKESTSSNTRAIKLNRGDLIDLLHEVMDEKKSVIADQFLSSTIISRGQKKRLLVDMNNLKWKIGSKKDAGDGMLISVPLSRTGSLILVSREDYDSLSLVESGAVTLLGFSSYIGEDMSYEELVYTLNINKELSVDTIESSVDAFSVHEKSIEPIYTTPDIIEFASELPYFLMTYEVLLNIVGEDEFSNIMAEIALFPNKEEIDISKYSQMDPFIFNISNIVEEERNGEESDFLSFFFSRYKSYLDKYQ